MKALEGRIREHRPETRKRLPLEVVRNPIVGHLMLDATRLFKFPPPQRVFPSTAHEAKYRHIGHISHISVEFKVKSGHVSTSPFVPDSRSVKRRHHRYKLMQVRLCMVMVYPLISSPCYLCFKCCTHNTRTKLTSITLVLISSFIFSFKPFSFTLNPQCHKIASQARKSAGAPVWGGSIAAASLYNPTDLCSGESSRVRVAVKALLEAPQNNFRVFLDGQLCYSGASEYVNM